MWDLVYFYPEGHQSHYQRGHPERPERVELIRQALDGQGWWQKYPKLTPVAIPALVLHSIHSTAYLDFLKRATEQGEYIDADTYTTPSSWQLALNAAGGATVVAQTIWNQESRRGYALTRPPGHHATRDRGMGFCLLNNIALAAEYLIKVEEAKRLSIIDLDLHHGNGTQDIFYHRSDVFYISIHQSPLYPGTGDVEETGAGNGKGYTANIPLPPFSGDRALQAVTEEVILPLIDRYQPEMLLVSYGFDMHWKDPLGSLLVSADATGQLVSTLVKWTDASCNGKIGIFLEGGYDLEAGQVCSLAVVAALLGLTFQDPLGKAPQTEGDYWQKTLKIVKQTWDLK